MFMSCVGILVLCLVKIFGKLPDDPDKPPALSPSTNPPGLNQASTLPVTEPLGLNQTPIPPRSSTDACEGNDCRSPPNLVGPIVGALCAILVVVLIGVLIIWYYLRRKTQPRATTPMTPSIKFIEYPPLYTGAISSTDSASRLYGMSPSRNDSISSHFYEKIQYNEQTEKST